MSMQTRTNAPYAPLARDSAVLLLGDYQVGPLWEPDAMQLRRDVVALAGVASTLGVPTILTAMACDDWGPIITELTDVTPSAVVIQRSVLDPWTVPRLRQMIEVTGRRHLILAGVATETCVVRAALGAAHDGYEVHAVLDVCGHFSPRAAAAAILRMRAAGVVVSNCATVLVELVRGDLERRACELLAGSLRHALPPPPAALGTGRRRAIPLGVAVADELSDTAQRRTLPIHGQSNESR